MSSPSSLPSRPVASNERGVRFRGFADEERVQAPWRVRAKANPDGSTDSVVDPPVSDELWEHVQNIRARRTTVAGRRRTDRVYVPNLHCHGCGSLVGYRRASRPDHMDITTGTLDDPSLFPPTVEIWLEQKIGWETLHPTLPKRPQSSLNE